MARYAFTPPRRLFLLFACLLGFSLPVAAAPDAHLIETYGKLPLHFEPNQGQAQKDVKFLSRGAGYSLYLTADEAVLVLAKPNPDAKSDARTTRGRHDAPMMQAQSFALRMRLVGATLAPPVSGLDELAGKANYFLGKDPAQWHTNMPTYGKVHYREVYPGIDLVYYGKQRQLEYDFVVASGADPTRIVLGFKGADKLEIDAHGDLVLHAAGGAIRQHKPIIYQEIDGTRQKIDGGYVLKGANRVGFVVAAYDRSRPLVIDPVLAYSTYLGGSDFESPGAVSGLFTGIAVDGAGNAYVTGATTSADFPTSAGAVQPTLGGTQNAFVTKINANGSTLAYSTYLGGSGFDQGSAIAVDAAGNAYVTGSATSTNFPTTPGAFQTAFGGGTGDVFATKLNRTGSALVYSTYLGGSEADLGQAIAVDSGGNAYLTGKTSSGNFPTTPGAYQTTFNGPPRFSSDAFVTKLNAAGTVLIYSTYLGGSADDVGYGIAVNAARTAFVTGHTSSANFPTTPGAYQTASAGSGDAFVTALNSSGSALAYSTYLGGSGFEIAYGIAMDAAGNVYVTGGTESSDFPTTLGTFQSAYGGGTNDAFVTKLKTSGAGSADLVYSTFVGGSGSEAGYKIAVDVNGNAYVVGTTTSADFPTMNAFQPAFGGFVDAFVTKLARTGSAIAFSTYLGGSDNDQGYGIALDASANVYVTGVTLSGNFPTTVGAFQPNFGGGIDAFVAKFARDSDNSPPRITAKAIPPANAAGWNKGPVIVMLGASDNKTGSGVASITYSINGATPVTVSGATASVTLSAENVNTLTYYATDKAGNAGAGKTLEVRIDATAPTGTVTLSPDTLWPPNHRFVTVTRSISATDNLTGPVKISAPVVTSNEPQRGLGHGDKAPDWVVSGNTLLLRAERADDGAGRVYTVTYKLTDRAGNSSQASATVTVPLNQ
jgi:hypothetical protein